MFFRAADLNRLVQGAGKTLTLSRTSGSSYDTSTGTMSAGTPISGNFKGYLFENLIQAFGDDSIVRGNRTLVVSSSDMPFEPEVGDSLSGDSDDLKVQAVKRILSGESVICYLCEVSE